MRPPARWLLGASAAVLAILAAGVASATTMRALTIESLAREADSVVLGRVSAVAEVATVDHGHLAPRTVTSVVVEELVAGSPTPRVVRLVESDGVLGALRVVHESSVALRRGQRVMLFLEATGAGYRTIGATQGALEVVTDRRTIETSVRRANDAGILLGSTKASGIDLDASSSLDDVLAAVRHARGDR